MAVHGLVLEEWFIAEAQITTEVEVPQPFHAGGVFLLCVLDVGFELGNPKVGLRCTLSDCIELTLDQVEFRPRTFLWTRLRTPRWHRAADRCERVRAPWHHRSST